MDVTTALLLLYTSVALAALGGGMVAIVLTTMGESPNEENERDR